MNPDHSRALFQAQRLRQLGLVVLPSREDAKRPTCDVTRFRSEPPPDELYMKQTWATGNLQVMCGAKTSGRLKIIVVDCDGEDGRAAWRKMWRRAGGPFEGTWIAATGGGGRHIYFALPDVAEAPSRPIWGLWDTAAGTEATGGWLKHKEVRIIGDGGLAIAPPSRHVETGKPYRWVGAFGPHVYDRPCLAPSWLLSMPSITAPHRQHQRPANQNYSHSDSPKDDIVKSLPAEEKIRLVEGWGLRLVRRLGNQQICRAVGRPDNNPSAVFNADTGIYHDFGTGESMNIFDLAVALGAYRDFAHAYKSLKTYAAVR